MTSFLANTPFLRWTLLGDAAASGASGVLSVLAAGALAPATALPEALLRGTGLVLVPYAVAVAWLGSRPSMRRGTVQAVIAANLLWALGCALLLDAGKVSPNALGVAFVLVQAATVAGLALLQWLAIRRGVAGRVAA